MLEAEARCLQYSYWLWVRSFSGPILWKLLYNLWEVFHFDKISVRKILKTGLILPLF